MITSLKKASLILIFPSALFFSLSTPLSHADYKFVDDQGNEVVLPTGKPTYLQNKPGPWKGLEAEHKIQLSIRTRKQGLELSKILTITVPHPTEDDKQGKITALYLLDKDGLVIGYKQFFPTTKSYSSEFWLNGVINYAQVYVECTKHGLWREDVRF